MNEFLEHINEHTEQEIVSNMPDIKQRFRYIHWSLKKEYLKEIFKIVDPNKVLYELFKNEEKFSLWKEKLDFPEKLKFGLEIESSRYAI